jgi:hypothetical protein
MGSSSVTFRENLPSADPILSLLQGGDGPRLYPGGHFGSEAAVARRLAHLDGTRRSARPVYGPADVHALLRACNAFAPLHPAQERNLKDTLRADAVYLFTGQQPGLLGGPLLWLCKALACAALADRWAARLGRPVVPVFWVAGDDSDLQECNHLELLEDLPPGLPSVLSLPFAEPERTLPVGARPVDPRAFDVLLAGLARLWRPETLASIRDWLPATGSLADAFLHLARRWLGPRGVLFLDGNAAAVRAAARPVLEGAVRRWDSIQAGLARGTSALAASGVEPPVALRDGVVHVFALQQGERRRLFAERAERAERAESGRTGIRLYTADRPGHDLLPELASLELTHDVFTRLLVVESLMPALGHVLGPAELRYFAQMAPVFLEETGDMPLVHPRMSLAAAPETAAAAFEGAGIPLSEAVALKPSDLRARLQARAWESHPASRELPAGPPAEWIAGLRSSHARHFKDAGPLDRLERAWSGAWSRYARSLGRMAYAESGDGSAGLFRALRWLGNGLGQDRHLNLHSLLDAVGEDGLEAMLAAADPAEPGTRIFTFADKERT